MVKVIAKPNVLLASYSQKIRAGCPEYYWFALVAIKIQQVEARRYK